MTAGKKLWRNRKERKEWARRFEGGSANACSSTMSDFRERLKLILLDCAGPVAVQRIRQLVKYPH